MIYINGEEIDSKFKLSSLIKKIEKIELIKDDNSFIEEYYGIKYKLNYESKKIFLSLLKKYFEDRFSLINYLNNNDVNISLDEDRLVKFITYTKNNNKDRCSKQYLFLKYGYYNENYYKDTYGIGIDKFVKKYGNIEGELKFEEFKNKQKNTSKRSIEYWNNIYEDENIAKEKLKEYQAKHTKKHFQDKTEDYINKYNKQNSRWCIEYYTKRGYNPVDAKLIISEIKRKESRLSLDYYLNKGYSIDEGNKMKNEYWLENCNNFLNTRQTSKESLKIFDKLYEWLIETYKNVCVYYGNNGKQEYFLYDKDNKKYNFYDFTILYKNIKIIIEYNGEKFHPYYGLTNEELNNWKQLYTNRTADEVIKMDNDKKDMAINNNFNYLVIWSNHNNNLNVCKQFIIKYFCEKYR